MLITPWSNARTCSKHFRWSSWESADSRDCWGSSGSRLKSSKDPPHIDSEETCSSAKTPCSCHKKFFNPKRSWKPIDGQRQVLQLLPGSSGASLLPQLLLGLHRLHHLVRLLTLSTDSQKLLKSHSHVRPHTQEPSRYWPATTLGWPVATSGRTVSDDLTFVLLRSATFYLHTATFCYLLLRSAVRTATFCLTTVFTALDHD